MASKAKKRALARLRHSISVQFPTLGHGTEKISRHVATMATCPTTGDTLCVSLSDLRRGNSANRKCSLNRLYSRVEAVEGHPLNWGRFFNPGYTGN